jgi:hypothetical protein
MVVVRPEQSRRNQSGKSRSEKTSEKIRVLTRTKPIAHYDGGNGVTYRRGIVTKMVNPNLYEVLPVTNFRRNREEY